MNYSAINPKKWINCTVQLILEMPGLWAAIFSTRTQGISMHLREPKCRFSCIYRHLCFCLHCFPSAKGTWALFLWGMKAENCSTVPKRPCKVWMCNLGTLTRPQGMQWKIRGMYADIHKARAGKPETLHKAQTKHQLWFLYSSPSTTPRHLPCNLLHVLTEEDNNKGKAHQEEQQWDQPWQPEWIFLGMVLRLLYLRRY